ncbi:DUF6059 family protein [Kitasatospora sp. NPDC001119]
MNRVDHADRSALSVCLRLLKGLGRGLAALGQFHGAMPARMYPTNDDRPSPERPGSPHGHPERTPLPGPPTQDELLIWRGLGWRPHDERA